MFKGLRFSEPFKWISFDIGYQLVNGGEDLLILFLPSDVFFPGLIGPCGFHAAGLDLADLMISRSLSFP